MGGCSSSSVDTPKDKASNPPALTTSTVKNDVPNPSTQSSVPVPVATAVSVSITKSAPNSAIPFAIMRNGHEALRMAIKHVLSRHLENGDFVQFHAAWTDFNRASVFHMTMEDADLFPLLNSVSDGKCYEDHLDQEHIQDCKLTKAIGDELAENNSVSISRFEEWRAEFLKHLEHEEKVMMPLTMKIAGTPDLRAAAVYTKLITPAFNRDKSEFLWYIGWCLTQLSTHGSTANSAAVAVRVFSHGLQAAADKAQWTEILPFVKSNVSIEQWNEMVADYFIDEPGKQTSERQE